MDNIIVSAGISYIPPRKSGIYNLFPKEDQLRSLLTYRTNNVVSIFSLNDVISTPKEAVQVIRLDG